MTENTAEIPLWRVPNKYKSGVIIVGDKQTPEGEKLHVVGSWAEGAFSWKDGKKAFTLPKGTLEDEAQDQIRALDWGISKISNNPSESRKMESEKNALYWQCAKREVFEETGIDIDRIRDPQWPQRPEPTEGFYDGVEIEQLIQTPVFDETLPSNRGNPAHHRMFVVKVKGIENLEPHLKHAQHNHTGTMKVKTTAKQAAKEQGLPSFKELLEVLRSGKWGDEVLFENSVLAEHDPDEEVKKPKQLDALFQSLHFSERSTMKDQLNDIKEHMEAQGMICDHEGLKLGNKHLPLRYYQEGADVLPYEDWVSYMVKYAKGNDIYRDIQFNADYLNKEEERMEVAPDAVSYAGMALKVGKLLDEARAGHAAYNQHKTPDQPEMSTYAQSIIKDGLAKKVDKTEEKVRQASSL